jgi:hypothetical protein
MLAVRVNPMYDIRVRYGGASPFARAEVVMSTARSLLTVAVLTIALFAPRAPWLPIVEARADKAADLRGAWVLNPDLSDDPRQKYGSADMEDSRRGWGKPRLGGGLGSPGGMSGPGMGGPIRSDRAGLDPEEASKVHEEIRQALNTPRRITIVQEPQRLVVTSDETGTHTLDVDGKGRKRRTLTGLQVEQKSKWKDHKLVTEVELPQGSYTQTWWREGTKLTIETKVDRPMGRSITVTRVYERDDEKR